MYLDSFKPQFERLRAKFHQKLIPCDRFQVEALERRCQLILPKSYREFLLWGGVWAGGFLQGEDCFYDSSLHRMRDAAYELLIEDDFPFDLPADAFVFRMHQGYIFYFFKTFDSDDPPVYAYKQGDAPVLSASIPFKQIASSFSDFLLKSLREDAGIIQDWTGLE